MGRAYIGVAAFLHSLSWYIKRRTAAARNSVGGRPCLLATGIHLENMPLPAAAVGVAIGVAYVIVGMASCRQ